MNLTIYRERRTGGRLTLEPIASVQVADNAPDPETTAWSTWTRGGIPEPDTYYVGRAVKGFTTREQKNRTASPLGPVSFPT